MAMKQRFKAGDMVQRDGWKAPRKVERVHEDSNGHYNNDYFIVEGLSDAYYYSHYDDDRWNLINGDIMSTNFITLENYKNTMLRHNTKEDAHACAKSAIKAGASTVKVYALHEILKPVEPILAIESVPLKTLG